MDKRRLPSVSVQARQRLGEEPLAELFALLTQAWSRPAVNVRQPLRVLAVDGVVWSAPDTLRIESNWAAAATSMASPWPQIRATCLMDTHSHEMLDAKLGAMDCGN